MPDNFRFPYAAVGFSDFWRRWHISLSSWLRDYLYISLGGSRRSNGRTYINLMVTMLLGGLWHGASWLFVIWGGLQSIYLIGERWCRKIFGHFRVWKTLPGQVALSWITFVLICFAWVFFRAETLDSALRIFGAMFKPTAGSSYLSSIEVLMTGLVTAATLVIHWLLRNETLESVKQRMPWGIRSLLLAVLISLTLLCMNGDDSAFIYFQF